MENPREPILFKKYPGLKGRVPWMELGKFPTPIDKMEKLAKIDKDLPLSELDTDRREFMHRYKSDDRGQKTEDR